MSKKYNKSAFTMAEVLITLMIIGIIAMVTIPSLIQKHQKKTTIVHLKKVVSTWTNAINLSNANLGTPNDSELLKESAEAIYKEYYAPYIKGKLCKTYEECNYVSAKPFLMLTNATYPFTILAPYNIGIITNDGMTYFFQSKGGSNELEHNHWIVDINGYHPPNKLGRDVFVFASRNNLELHSELTNTQLQEDCSKKGVSCFSKIIRDGWEIKDDYPF